MELNRLEMVKRFVDNMERERVLMGLSQEVMARELDISLSTYKRLINYEIEKIDLYVAYRLFMLTGKLAYEFVDISDEYLDLKKKIGYLSSSQLMYVKSIVDFELDFADTKKDFEDFVTVYIPTGNMEDGMIYDSSNVEKVNIAPYRKKYGNIINCGIRITSNHLHPAYNKGDILLISRKAIRDGDTGIFLNREDGCAYVRKFYQTQPCRLEPVNGNGETFYVDPDNKEDMDRWIKFGRVITKIR